MSVFQDIDGSFIIGDAEILSKKELMDKMHISRSTIQRLIRKGMPCQRFQYNHIAFNIHDVKAWLDSVGYPSYNCK